MVAAAFEPAVDPVAAFLSDRMTLVVGATPGPFTLVGRPGGAVQVVSARRVRPLATFARHADALLFVQVAGDLRALIGVIVELIAGHHDDRRGRCAKCLQPAPCQIRRIIAAELAPRTSRHQQLTAARPLTPAPDPRT
jgi:hypothetical protein